MPLEHFKPANAVVNKQYTIGNPSYDLLDSDLNFAAMYSTSPYLGNPYYTGSITVTGTIPSFLTITGTQIKVNQMSLPTDLPLTGTYPLTVNLWSTDPFNNFKVASGSYTLNLQVIDPCQTAILDATKILPSTTQRFLTQLAGTISFTDTSTDSVTTAYGSPNACGGYQYKLLAYTPSSSTSNLISLTNPLLPKISFSQTFSLPDANIFSFQV